MIPNPSAEEFSNGNPLSWVSLQEGTMQARFSVAQPGHTGNNALFVKSTSGNTGDAQWMFPLLDVTSGSTYKFTDYYKATVLSYVVIDFKLADGTDKYQDIGEYDPTTSWQLTSGVFTAPDMAIQVGIAHYIRSVGTLTTDDYTLAPVSDASFNRALVSITFDDGDVTQYTNARPLLNQYNEPSTYYIISGDLRKTGYMNASQIAQLQQEGNQIGSHTVTHPFLTSLTTTQLTNELKNSKNKLQGLYGSVMDFATPYGYYNDTVLRYIRKYYHSNRISTDGLNTRQNFNIYTIKVKAVLNTTTLSDVQTWVAQAQQTNSWLVLLYHRVESGSSDPYTVDTNVFASQVQTIHDSGIPVETMNTALAEIQPQLP